MKELKEVEVSDEDGRYRVTINNIHIFMKSYSITSNSVLCFIFCPKYLQCNIQYYPCDYTIHKSFHHLTMNHFVVFFKSFILRIK